jgi:hypothetical protein
MFIPPALAFIVSLSRVVNRQPDLKSAWREQKLLAVRKLECALDMRICVTKAAAGKTFVIQQVEA